MADDVKIAYDKTDLRGITRAFKGMSDEAVEAAKKESSNLAEYASQQIKISAATRTVSGTAARRIADGVKVSKTSKIGEFSYGFARQKFSGGGSTKMTVYKKPLTGSSASTADETKMFDVTGTTISNAIMEFVKERSL